MALALDGLASGLPTTELIADLMKLEAIPQTLLKNKVTSTQTAVAALQALNAKISALATLAGASAKANALDFNTVSSSSTTVVATAASGTAGGTLDVVVTALAQSQAGVTAPLTVLPDPPVLTIVGSDGTSTTVTAASTSLDDAVRAVNASGAGVIASKVASGTAADGTPQFRLQFTGAASGAAEAFTVFRGAAADGVDLLAQPGAAVTRVAQDASITLWGGTAAEQAVTSATNTFADLLPGVSVTVSGVSADPVTISVVRDTAKTSSTVGAFISALNDAFAYISTRTVVTNSTDASGKAILSPGVFTGDGTVRDLSKKMLEAASAPVNGKSPSEFGISITKTGTMAFDAEKFAAAFAKDPATVQAAVAEIAGRVAAAAQTGSDKTTGTLTTKITGQQSVVTSLSDQVLRWDTRLADRKASLVRLYAAFEVRMSNLTAQQTWLTDQVDSLKGSTS